MIAKLWQNEEEVTETWLNGMEKRKETQWLFQLTKLFHHYITQNSKLCDIPIDIA